MTRRLKLAGAGTAPSCLIRGCERVPRKGTKLCKIHAEALRPAPAVGTAVTAVPDDPGAQP